MSQNNKSQDQLKEEFKEEKQNYVLELNKAYWESRHNNHSVNSLGHYDKENTINKTIKECFLDLNKEECCQLFNVFKQNQVNFDSRSYPHDTTLLFDYARFKGIKQESYAISIGIQQEINAIYCDQMNLLLDYGADPNFVLNPEQNKKMTCLMASIQDRTRFKLLLDYGADPLFIPDNQWDNIFDTIDDTIKQFENNNVQFNPTEAMVLQNNIDDIKINRDQAKSFIQKQQMNNQFQSKQSNLLRSPSVSTNIQINQVLSSDTEKENKISRTTEENTGIKNRKQKPIL